MEEIVKYETRDIKVFQPVMSIEEMKDRYQMMARVTSEIMRAGQDYGAIPGTGSKPSLLKPGAEKLATFFGLRKEFSVIAEEDWTGAEHGEPHFYYLVRCSLYRDDVLVAAADGSCNSWESRYRWRKAARICPFCRADAIIKGKAEYGGGWLCFKKKGGCGAKFKDGDKSIEGQPAGRVPNQDIFDQVNTILKMAEKRALVAAVLLAVGASEFFTQDMEDIIDAEWTEHEPPKQEPRQEPKATPKQQQDADDLYGHPIKKQPEKNGEDRPWSAVTLKANLLKRTEQLLSDQYADNDGGDEWDDVPNPDFVGLMTGRLNGILGDDDRRHTFLKFVFGNPSTKTMDKAEVQAVMDWLDGQAGMATITDEANRLVNGVVTADAVGTLLGDEEEPNDVG